MCVRVCACVTYHFALYTQQTSYDGVLLWRVGDVRRRREEAKAGRVASIYSHAFYTSRTGYKMCARLYFNGDGMGRNTHLSLYFVICQGDFDGLLKWPFKQKVVAPCPRLRSLGVI